MHVLFAVLIDGARMLSRGSIVDTLQGLASRLFQNARQWKFSSRMSDWHFQFETAENVRLTAQQERAHW